MSTPQDAAEVAHVPVFLLIFKVMSEGDQAADSHCRFSLRRPSMPLTVRVPAVSAQPTPRPAPHPQSVHSASSCPPSTAGKGPAAAPRCSLPGCSALAQRIGGGPAEFCCADHASRAQARGLVGRSAALAPQVERVWPTASGQSGAGGGCGTVALMTRGHAKYAAVRQQFLEAWRHPQSVKARPVVQRIYQASLPPPDPANAAAPCAPPRYLPTFVQPTHAHNPQP